MSTFQAESENKGKNQDWGEVEREMFGEILDGRKTWRNPNMEALSEIYSYVEKVTWTQVTLGGWQMSPAEVNTQAMA